MRALAESCRSIVEPGRGLAQMSLDQPPSGSPNKLADPEYEEIAAAVMETVRGRLFLAEHARRIREAETKGLHLAIIQLKRTVELLCLPSKPVRINAGFGPMMKVVYDRVPVNAAAECKPLPDKMLENKLVTL